MLQKRTVERDTWVLLERFCADPLFEEFALGGGTNLALRYGHRRSIDLDFFSSASFDAVRVQAHIFDQFQGATLLFARQQTLVFSIAGVKVDFVCYPFHWQQPFEHFGAVRLIALPDLIPMKLQAIGNRRTKKDYFDIYELLKHFSLRQLFEIFTQKFPQIDFAYIVHSLTDSDEADADVDPDLYSGQSWPGVKETLINAVKSFSFDSI